MPAGIAEVAAKAGVSVATASRAINGRSGVSPATRARVLAAAAELRYVANNSARGLVTASTGTIGWVMHRFRPQVEIYPFYEAIMHGMDLELSHHGYHLMVTTMADEHVKDAASLGLVSQNRVDGLVLVGPGIPARFILQFRPLELPVLLIDNMIDAVPVDTVRNDDVQGGRIATEHLIGHGHQAIAALLGPDAWPSSALRGAGYRQAALAAGIEPVLFHGEETTPESGDSLLRQALAARPELTAIFTANDAMAFGAMRAIHSLGRSVPRDIAVIGFDDVTAAAFCHPELTTIRVFKRELGRLAALRMLDLVEQPESPPVQTLLATELIVRRSCGCHPATDTAAEPWQALTEERRPEPLENH
jgi:LacI family transcriptional regulator